MVRNRKEKFTLESENNRGIIWVIWKVTGKISKNKNLTQNVFSSIRFPYLRKVRMYHGIQGSTPHIKERDILSHILHEHSAGNKKIKLLRRQGGLLIGVKIE